ncbi:uncharacterized protein LOC117318173 [Pecten maximus]|uniref:uncharacterized protein LOC117318173 n=1 Tax=Pecten maximus TaxID=6579 RepID=UPI001458E9EE|nr:uncharacterized protein LOC117318173 [Pecten maximus]
MLMLCSQCECECTDLKHCFKTSKPGRINGNSIKTRNGTGYRDCYNDCVRHSPQCCSFNYNKFTGYCELTDVVPSVTNVVQDNDFIYSRIPSSGLIPPACTNQYCSLVNYQICILLSTGIGTCIQECQLLSQPTNGETAYNNTFSVAGTEILLTCDAGYRKIGAAMTCLTSGAWIESFCVPVVCTFETPCDALETDLTASSIFEIDSGSTKSKDTGCTEDHTTGTGNYYYFETSDPMQPGDTARMKSTFPVPAGQQVCVHLWYLYVGIFYGKFTY